jgi:polyhydroxybutyrate depolymerase
MNGRRLKMRLSIQIARRQVPRRDWLRLARLAQLALLLPIACAPGGGNRRTIVGAAPGTGRYEIRVGGSTRSFLLHVPPARPRRFGLAVAFPLVVVLHGSGADGETIRHMSGLDALADSARFLVAYPDGVTGAFGLQSDWNAGDCCGVAADQKVDDVGFIHALIGSVAARLPVDRRRIYVAGFSDGARMAYRVGCDLGNEVAAVAIVAGSLLDSHCSPRRAVPLVAFHGTADLEVPYLDSTFAPPRGPAPAPGTPAAVAPPSIRFWASVDRCSGAILSRRAPHVTVTRFSPCRADVVLFTVEDGIHAWPGDPTDDDATHEISASAEIWRFFRRHPMP